MNYKIKLNKLKNKFSPGQNKVEFVNIRYGNSGVKEKYNSLEIIGKEGEAKWVK